MMLKGKVALVTGSAKRTGKYIALALAKQGADVVIHFNKSKKEAGNVVHEIRAMGRRSVAIKADLRNPKEAEILMDKITIIFGRVDILVNNVGNFLVKDITKLETDEWNHLIDTTLNSTFYCCKYALPYMAKQKYGRIINIADSGADYIKPWPRITPYMIGKTGILILTKTLAEAYAKHGITVNAISPGVMENAVVKPIERMPMGRYANYEDITNAILFLLKNESNYVTGTNLKVSGGYNT